MGFNELVRSKPYKNFMAKLYGIGAAVVISGALFKILHLPGANIMLLLGMGTESIIFLFSAFEPLHVEYNWALVYPELALGEEHDKPSKDKKKLSGSITQQLDNALTEAKIGPELLESLASGMRNLSDNAKQLSGMSDAVVATDGYVTNLTKASESVRNLSVAYEKTSENIESSLNKTQSYFTNVEKASSAVGNLANVYESTIHSMTSGANYNEEVSRLSKNLCAINAAYELQLQSTNETLNISKSLDGHLKTLTTNLEESTNNILNYKEQVDKLAKNVSKLNDIYGNMLAAMSNKM
ncbi:MAG: gliding motility protein GldL [Bacteroidales bacterium]|nr:gliding motility protein GldL [Bacteroidales bacterium]